MPTITVYPNANARDATSRWNAGNANYTDTTTDNPFPSTTSTSRLTAGIQFALSVPRTDIISACTLTLRFGTTKVAAEANCDIYAEAVDNASTFAATTNTTTGGPGSRVKTTATAQWINVGFGTVGNAWSSGTSPSLNSVVQEVVDRAGWSSGNYLCLLLQGRSVNNTGSTAFASYNNGSEYPALTLTHTPSNTAPTTTVTAPTEGQELTNWGPSGTSVIGSLSATFTDPDAGQTIQTWYELQTSAGAALASGYGTSFASPVAGSTRTWDGYDYFAKGSAYRWRSWTSDGTLSNYSSWRNFTTAAQPTAPTFATHTPTGGTKVVSLMPTMSVVVSNPSAVAGSMGWQIRRASDQVVVAQTDGLSVQISQISTSAVAAGASAVTRTAQPYDDTFLVHNTQYEWRPYLKYTGYSNTYRVYGNWQAFETYRRRPNLVKLSGTFTTKPVKVKVGGVFVDVIDPQ